MIFGDGVAVSVVRGAYSELDVGLCELDVFFDIGTAQLKKVLGRLKTGLPRRHRIQSVEGPVLDPRAKETCLKRGQKVDPLFFSVQRQMALARSLIKPERQLHCANSPN